MSARTSRAASAPRLDIVGELTIHTAAERKAALTALLESAGQVRIGLADVTELDTAGLQLLLMAKREAAQLGRTLRFEGASRAVTEVLAIAHLSPTLDELSAPGTTGPAEETDR